MLGSSITVKIESLNPVRSFKGRGTEKALSRLAQREEAPTAVCASAGTCEGAGTIGLELLGRGTQFDTLVIALGGGALASGVGHVAKSLAPHVEVVAVQPTGAPAMALSLRRGSVVATDTVADGVVEPSAALGVATVLENRERFTGRRVATIICGSNVATSDYERWVLRPG